MSTLRRILWGVNADRLTPDEQAHIEWADSLLTPKQKMSKALAEAGGYTRGQLSDPQLTNYRDPVDRLYYRSESHRDLGDHRDDMLELPQINRGTTGYLYPDNYFTRHPYPVEDL